MGAASFDQTPASLTILCIIIGFSALALWVAPRILDRNLLRPYWMIKERDYSTLITSGFIHKDFVHLLFNSITLWSFGPALERRIGTEKFLALYFIGLVLSSLSTVYKQRNNPDYGALGASGAILSVLFAFIVYYPKNWIIFYFVPIPAVLFAFLYMAYSWWASRYRNDNIGHDAHLDGALIGLIFVGVTDMAAWKHAFALMLG